MVHARVFLGVHSHVLSINTHSKLTRPSQTEIKHDFLRKIHVLDLFSLPFLGGCTPKKPLTLFLSSPGSGLLLLQKDHARTLRDVNLYRRRGRRFDGFSQERPTAVLHPFLGFRHIPCGRWSWSCRRRWSRIAGTMENRWVIFNGLVG